MPIKRLFDISLATLALAGATPIMLILALLVRWRQGSPVLFRQERGGLEGRPFHLVKFRTMTNARDADGNLLPDDQRITRLGRFLRTTTLDELPSLWNVIKGEMSLVGPRPLFSGYTALYTPHQARRLEVRPGLTGWAVVKGRNRLTWEERFELDVWYVDNQSLWLDMKIILSTVGKIIRRDDVNQSGYATMPRFSGTGNRAR